MERRVQTPQDWRRFNRGGFALMLLGAALTAVAVVMPGRWHLGPLVISLRSVRNPICALVVGYMIWRATYDGYGRWLKSRLGWLEGTGEHRRGWLRAAIDRFRLLWKRWGWRERLMFAAIACQVLIVLRFWQGYPAYLAYERDALANSYRMPTFKADGRELPLVESFSRRVCKQLPPDARILFHGQTAGLRFAYEVYPRRVFLLPQDMRNLAAGWHVQPQLRSLPEDRQLAYWQKRLPNTVADERQFIREHRIDYVVTFDEYELAKCRVECVR